MASTRSKQPHSLPGANMTRLTMYPDGPQFDAFGRFRTSSPTVQFDSKQIFDKLPFFWDDQETSGGSTTSVHSVDRASTILGVAASTAGVRQRQTFQRFTYQPGKSQQILISCILNASGGGAGITRHMGYFSSGNGLFFLDDEGTFKVGRRTSVTGSKVDNLVAQTDWNLDPFDGSGESGFTLDLSKANIYVIDFEWLGSGRARMGFSMDGVTTYCHEFLNANTLTSVYMSTPNLPICFRIENTGSGAASTMEDICVTVISEGEPQDNGVLRYKSTAGTAVAASTAGTVYAVIGMRLKSTATSCAIRMIGMSLINESGQDFEWLVIWKPTVAGTFTYADETNSCVQTATGATANTVTDGTIIAGGCVKSSQSAGSVSTRSDNAIALGTAIDGTVDEIVLCVRPMGNNATIQASISWRELA